MSQMDNNNQHSVHSDLNELFSNNNPNLNLSGLSNHNSQSPAKKKKKKNSSSNNNSQVSSLLASHCSDNSQLSMEQDDHSSNPHAHLNLSQSDDEAESVESESSQYLEEINTLGNDDDHMIQPNSSNYEVSDQDTSNGHDDNQSMQEETDYEALRPQVASVNFPFMDDPDLIQIELLDIKILIRLASACKYTISDTPGSHQAWQRQEFISLYHSSDAGGFKFLAREFMIDYLGEHPDPVPTQYEEQKVKPTVTLTINDLTMTNPVISTDISSTNIITRVSVHMNAPDYMDKLVHDLNNGHKASLSVQSANSSTACSKLILAYASSHILNEIPTLKGCNQVLAMTIAQARAASATVINTNLSDIATVDSVIEFLTQVNECMSLCNQRGGNHNNVKQKVMNILSIFQQHKSKLSQLNYVFNGLPLDSDHRFDIDDISSLLLSTSSFLKFRFYVPAQTEDLSDRQQFRLLNTHPQSHHNHEYHTLEEVQQALNLGVVCCLPSSTGDSLGRMYTMTKYYYDKQRIQSVFTMLNDKTKNIITALPALCPNLRKQRSIMNDLTQSTTMELMRSQEYQYVHVSGIPEELSVEKNSPDLHKFLFRANGVFNQVHIDHPHMYRLANSVSGYEVHTLDPQPYVSYYKVDSTSIVMPLNCTYTTHIPIRSVSAKRYDRQHQDQLLMVVCTFMTQSQVHMLRNGVEVMSVRPISPAHVSQLSKLIVKHYQNITLTQFTVTAIKLNSKVMLKNKKHEKREEIALVLHVDDPVGDINQLWNHFNVPQVCSKDSTVLYHNTILLQVAHQSKHFAFRGYPGTMLGSTTVKFCIVHSVHFQVDPALLVQEFQKDVTKGHCIRYVYKIPLTSHTIDLIIGFTLENFRPQDLATHIRTTLTKLEWYQASETRLQFLTHYPGIDPQNSLAVFQRIVHIQHPHELESNWSAVQSKKTKSNKSATTTRSSRSTMSDVSNSSVNSNSSSQSQQKQQSIADFFKPQQATSSNQSSINQE